MNIDEKTYLHSYAEIYPTFLYVILEFYRIYRSRFSRRRGPRPCWVYGLHKHYKKLHANATWHYKCGFVDVMFFQRNMSMGSCKKGVTPVR